MSRTHSTQRQSPPSHRRPSLLPSKVYYDYCHCFPALKLSACSRRLEPSDRTLVLQPIKQTWSGSKKPFRTHHRVQILTSHGILTLLGHYKRFSTDDDARVFHSHGHTAQEIFAMAHGAVRCLLSAGYYLLCSFLPAACCLLPAACCLLAASCLVIYGC